MKCPACQKNNPAAARFCSFCGRALAAAAPPPDLEAIQKQIHRGAYAKALPALERLAAQNPADARLLCWWGHALYFSGSFQEASQKYQAALRLDPGLWEALFQAASIAYSQKRYQEAVGYFEKLVDLKPDPKNHLLAAAFGGDKKGLLASAHLYLGLALRELAQVPAAQAHLEQAASLDGSNALPFGVLGDLHMAQHAYEQAVQAYGQALDRVSDPASQLALHNDLGVAYFRAGRLAEAVEQFKRVILKDPQNQNAIHNLGVLYLKQGLPSDLKQDWQDFLKADEAASILVGLTRSMVEAAKTEGGLREPARLLGESPAMRQVFELIQKAGSGTANVLILGENGTGKELVARAIHQASPRAAKPFIAINCGALPEGLLESELFGHEKGAFTGAYASKPGRFELAQGGTLFLDEIGDLNPSLQVKLLRVIQERSFERLGGTRTLQADVRLIAATHHDLRQKVAEGAFREDLFYRLFVIAVSLPPLRERREDIPLLAAYFLERFSRKNGKHFSGIHAEALALLEAHAWPGNVRELENVIERAVALYDDSQLLPSYLQLGFDEAEKPVRPLAGGAGNLAPASRLDSLEKQHIMENLQRHHFKVPKTASALGISRATLYRKLEKYKIDLKSLNG